MPMPMPMFFLRFCLFVISASLQHLDVYFAMYLAYSVFCGTVVCAACGGLMSLPRIIVTAKMVIWPKVLKGVVKIKGCGGAGGFQRPKYEKFERI